MKESTLDKFCILPVLGYAVLFFVLYGILYFLGLVDELPNQEGLLKWDANFYSSIKDFGYIYKEGEACNSGFFPLFAYFWKLSSLDALGVSILNGIIYLISLAFLCRLLKSDAVLVGLFMSLPFMFFMYVPLSESLFFLFGTCILYGVVKENNKYIFIGLFLASLTKSSSLFFIPALVGMTLMSNSRKAVMDVAIWRHQLKWYILPVLLAVITVGFIQYAQTGRFFAYYEIQSTAWGRRFGLPVFPLGRSTEIWINRLSWFNFWVGMLVSVLGLTYLFDWLIRNAIIDKPNRYELFSLIYLIMSFLSIVFFNPEWFWAPAGYTATYLNGINRYMQVNPFMFVFIVFLFKIDKGSPHYIFYLFLATHVVWFMVAPDYFKHIQSFMKVFATTLLLSLYWLYHYLRWRAIGYTTMVVSFVLQCIMFNYFMMAVQVD